MLSLYALKPSFQAVLRPSVRHAARAGLTANVVTLSTMVLCAAYGLLLGLTGRAALPGLPLVLLLRMALNAVDGMLAREHGQASVLGARLNEIGDVASDLCLYVPLALLLPQAPLALLVILTGLLAEVAGILAGAHGGVRDYAGPFGKSDRAAFFGGLALLLALADPPWWLLSAALGLALAGGLFTTVRRLTQGVQSCQS